MQLNVYGRDGHLHELRSDGTHGTVMEIIRASGLPIPAECGGSCACATCHIYVEEGWWPRLVPPGEDELAMLELADAVTERSRLSCQLRISADMDGLVVRLAPVM